MARKLLDDCFLHDRDRMRHDEAITLLRERIRPVTSRETVPLDRCGGRLLANPVIAPNPVPAHTNSAVDGYAFAWQHYDPENGSQMPIAGRAAAGHRLDANIPPASSIRIFTGAVMPDGCDTVVMQEDVELIDSSTVKIPSGLKSGANVRQAGEDVTAGTHLFATGHVIRPQDLAALASIGCSEVECFAPLNVAIVSTGDEIVRPGHKKLSHGEVFDANAPMLTELAQIAGAKVTDLGIWSDNAETIERNLSQAACQFDVILTSGSASRGEEDHVLSALDKIGSRHMWQLAVKPGRPIMFGQIGDAVMIGLPGNPVAVFVCFLMYVFPVLRCLSGGRWPEPRRFTLPAAFSVPKRKTGRREFFRATLIEEDGAMTVEKFARDGSGLITGLRVADGLVDIDEDLPAIKPGDPIHFIPFSEFGIIGR